MSVFERAKTVHVLDRAATVNGIVNFFFLWLYSPIQALAASMKLSVSRLILDLEQSVALLGRVIS
jgi:hypothetical protein